MAILICIVLIVYSYAERRIIYREDKSFYEVHDEKSGKLIRIIKNNESIEKNKSTFSFPYQQG